MAKPGHTVIRLDKSRDEHALFVGLNGTGYMIQRGKDVEVPDGVAEIIRNSLKAEDAADDYKESAIGDGKEAATRDGKG